MFYDFIYLAKGFRMRPKIRSTLKNEFHFRMFIEVQTIKLAKFTRFRSALTFARDPM